MLAIFAGLKKALSAALGFCWNVFDFVLSLPFLLLGAATGPGAAPRVVLPTIKEKKSTGISAAEVTQALRRESQIVFSYAGGCILAKSRLPTPSQLSGVVKGWLPGLTTQELQALTNAGWSGIFEHLKGSHLIAGVRAVQQLPSHELEFAPVEADPADGLAMLMHEIRDTGPNSP